MMIILTKAYCFGKQKYKNFVQCWHFAVFVSRRQRREINTVLIIAVKLCKVSQEKINTDLRRATKQT